MIHKNIIKVEAKNPPVVEMDTTIRAAYVRFSNKRVADTKVVTEDRCTVTIDMDSHREVVGIELIGVDDFQISGLLKIAGVTVPEPLLGATRYVPAKFQAA
jgi:uncharacterized protein YuzE